MKPSSLLKKLFGNTKHQFTIRTQTNEAKVTDEKDILLGFNCTLDDPDEFAVLAADQPIHEIEFVQAYVDNPLMHMEIGLLNDQGRQLLYTTCSVEACRQAFLDFYHGVFRPSLSDYAPVEFL